MTEGQSSSRMFSPGPRRFAFLVGFSALLSLAFLVFRSKIDLARPIPWADEGSFLFQALGFRDHGSLFAPEINPERHVLWMPPGFMILEGLIFRIVPFSLSASRTLSALFLCGAFLAIAGIVRNFRAAPALVLLFPIFLFSPIFEVVGNVARMEALVLFLSTAAFLLIAEGSAFGVALLLFGPLVHPNAVFPAAFGIPYFLFTRRGLSHWSRGARAATAVVLVCWVVYFSYVFRHIEGFRIDMWNQMKFKTFISMEDGGPLVRLRLPVVSGPVIALGLLGYFGRRCAAHVTPLLLLAATWTTQTLVASGWLYEVYSGYAVLLVSMALLETLTFMRFFGAFSSRFQPFAVVGFLLGLGFVDDVAVHTPFVTRSLDRATTKRTGFSPRYFDAEDASVVGEHLRALSAERPIQVQFVPDGEALLFTELRSERLGFVQQTFYTGGFNVAVLHDSAWCPTFIRDLEYLHVMALHHFQPPKITEIRRRDGSESWRVFEWPEMSENRPPPIL